MPCSRRTRVAAIAAVAWAAAVGLGAAPRCAARAAEAAPLRARLTTACGDCHAGGAAEGGLSLEAVGFDLGDPAVRDRLALMHDRVAKRQMPPDPADLPDDDRRALLAAVSTAIAAADRAAIRADGRVPPRRLNRLEYQETLRDILRLPDLDVAERLPEDRVRDGFNKSAEGLDVSRIQLAGYLDAAEAALERACAATAEPVRPDHFFAIATDLFPEAWTFGEREAMFFAKGGRALDLSARAVAALRKTRLQDPAIECCLFRSAYWPYYGYPPGFVAQRAGPYRLRLRARAVVQEPGFAVRPAEAPVPMTFRARRPSGADVGGDVRAVGGIFDVPPVPTDFEAVVRLKAGETVEYSLLGLPVPLARNVDGGASTYRFPPFPAGGQPGVAIQSLEIVGPLPADAWPPESHRVLFGDLPTRAAAAGARPAVEVVPVDAAADARRLLAAFAERAAIAPLSADDLAAYERLVADTLAAGAGFTRALLVGYAAVLCSPHVVYLHEPRPAGDRESGTASGSRVACDLAARLSYCLWNTRPDAALLAKARDGSLLRPEVLRGEVDRLLADPRFARFVANFTDYWLDLRHLRRDEPDVRLYPEYRFDDYLVESMGMETRAFVTALVRDNLPVRSLVAADFVLANDRLARHYGLPPLAGYAVRPVPLPPGSPLGGLLTQAAIQKVTANGTHTSPVVRGAWVMTRLLGQPPPKPPASVPAVEPDIRGATTIRDLLARHTADASCSSCHALFDPVGFALEVFDVCGGRRDRYRGLEEGDLVAGIDRAGHDFAYRLAAPVDPSGSLPDGRAFTDVAGLKVLLAGEERQLARNLLGQLTAYATGGPVRFGDRPEIEAILDACGPTGYRVGDLVRGLLTSRIVRGLPPAGPAEERPT